MTRDYDCFGTSSRIAHRIMSAYAANETCNEWFVSGADQPAPETWAVWAAIRRQAHNPPYISSCKADGIANIAVASLNL